MTDTPEYIRRIYGEFIMQKSEGERFKMGFDMADVGQKMVEEQFLQQYPDWSVGERKSAVFERIYRNDFSVEEMIRIKTSIIAYYQQKQA